MPPIKRPPVNFRMFTDHGFIRQGAGGSQIYGRCPFCGKDRHFFINATTAQWDCKVCGYAGGSRSFLHDIAKHCRQHFTGKIAEELAINRGIGVAALRKNKIAYNPLTKEYLIPIPYADDSGKLLDIRRYCIGRHGIRSTSGCHTGLLGWGNGMSDASIVWLCEGEWDKIAADDGVIREGEVSVGVPGAPILKNEWIQLFSGKTVHACYDNDTAGEAGAQRAYQKLASTVTSIKFIHWPKTAADKRDVRDEWVEKKQNARKYLLGLLEPLPPGMKADGEIAEINQVENLSKQPKGIGVAPADVYKKFTKWLLLPDTLILDIMFGTVLAHRIPGDPVWMFIVGPPGSGKTEPLDALTGGHRVITKSTLSSKMLVSGQIVGGGIEPSLLPRLHEKVLVVKDFTTILTLGYDEMQELRGILRDSYDGKFERDYGNGKTVKWKTHYGFLAGVTRVIEQHATMSAAFGERFLCYHLPLSSKLTDRRAFVKRACGNVGKEVEMKKELQEIAIGVLNHTFNFSINISEQNNNRLIDMAQCTALLRGTVARDRYTKDITHSSYSELGTRLVKQYKKLALGISAFHRSNELHARAMEAVRRIALDSIPTERRDIIQTLCASTTAMQTSEVAERVNLPASPTCDRLLHDLAMLGAVAREKGAGFNNRFQWRVTDELMKSINDSKLFVPHKI